MEKGVKYIVPKNMALTLAAGIVKKGLVTLSAGAVTHGIINSNQTETFVSAGMLVVGLGWSFWNDYGRAIVLSQLEVLKAKSLAQAAKISQAGLPPVTVTQIADQSATLTPASVTKTIATLPAAVQANVAKTSLSVLAITVALASLLCWPSDAQAQTRKLPPPAVTGDLKKDLQTDGQNLGIIPPSLQVTPTGNVAKDLQTIWDKIITASTTDLTYASKLAGSANTPASAVRKQCWDAIITINNQASGLNLKNADGTPLAKPDPHAFTDVETLAEVIDNLSPSGPLFTACAGAAQLAKTNVLTFVNAVVTGAAGMAAMPIIPGL